MASGDRFNRANVTVGETRYRNVRAIVFDNTATLYDLDTGDIVLQMTGPVEITNVSQDGATWSNGTDTWEVRKAGCACRGGGD